MTLQRLGRRARRTALILVIGAAAVGALAFAEIVRAYTRAPTSKGSPSS